MSSRVLMHFNDGSTLTDDELFPHELTADKAEALTSVERVIQGRHITIMKSPLVQDFFVITDAYRDWSFTDESTGNGDVTLRTVGCHLKGSDPLVRIMLSMDPRTMSVLIRAEWVKSFDSRGFAATLNPPPNVRRHITKDLDDSHWSILDEPPVRRVWGTEKGLACLMAVNKEQRAIAEVRLVGTNCQLMIVPE